MKRNNFILFGVLIILVLVYLAVSYFDDGGRSKSFREELVDINQDEVTKVEISVDGSTTILSGGPDDWQVQLKDGTTKPAKKANVYSMLSSLSSIEPARIASRSEAQWADFQVDSSGTRVVVYEGNNKTLDIILGRFGVEGQQSFYTYVRLAEENDTYVANNFMSMSISKDPAAFRNNEILRLKKDSLATISFNYPDSAFNLSKSEGKWLIGGEFADSARVASYLSGLSLVTSRNFDEPASSSVLSVDFGFNNQESVSISLDDEGILSSGYNEYESFNDSTAINKIFKGKSYFLP